MSASVNKVILVGNLGAKPELKYLPSGQAVCELRIATNETWKDKDGEKHEKAEWHSVKVWGKTGENCAQYLDKGRTVYVEGRLETRTWDDKTTGEKKYKTEVVASSVQFLGGDNGGGGKRSKTPKDTSDSGDTGVATDWGGPPSDDDIPF